MKRNKLARNFVNTLAASALVVAAGSATAGDAKTTPQSWQGQTYDAFVDGKIEASYALNRYLNPFEIDTKVDRGVVTLSGDVESQIDKDLAEEIARGVDGVKEVHNELVVEPDTPRKAGKKGTDRSFGEVVSDATVTARVKFALLENESTEGLKIDVDTSNGTVSLQGTVESKQERELAERLARNAEGVVDVENELTVTKS